MQARLDGGVAGVLDLRQAETLLYGATKTIPDIQRQIEQRRTSSTSCSGRIPARSSAAARSISRSRRRRCRPGCRSELLTRRPDIRQAEQRLVSANAQIGVATALLYPQVTISGFAGAGGATINGANFGPFWIFNALPAITLPIFNMGRLQANVDYNEARAHEAGLRYRQTLSQALREVSDALVDVRKRQEFRRQQDCSSTRWRTPARSPRCGTRAAFRVTWKSWIRSASSSTRNSNWSQAKRDESLERDPALQGPRRGMADRAVANAAAKQ